MHTYAITTTYQNVLINLIPAQIFFFFKKNLENLIIFLVVLTTSIVHNKWFLLNFSFLNCYNNILFWKFSSMMNNTKLNIVVLSFVCLLSGFIYQTELSLSKFLKLTVCLLASQFTHSPNYINTSTSSFFFTKKINSALLNGVLNIHPWLVFTLYGLLLFFFIVWLYKPNTTQNNKNIFFILKSNQNILWTLAFVFIILGSYWSFQELSWGGWWNWDVVELTSLNFFLFVGLITHLGSLTSSWGKKKTLVHIFVLIFLTTFVLVRYNVISSIHAFINTQAAKTNLIKIVFISLYFLNCLVYFTFAFFKKDIQKLNKNTAVSIFFKTLLRLTLLYTLTFVVFSLFLPNGNVNITTQIEFFFIVGSLYLILYFSHFSKKNLWIFLSSAYPLKNLEFIWFISLNHPNKSNTHHEYQNNTNTLHKKIFFVFIVLYFLKVYFIGYAHSTEFVQNTFLNFVRTSTYTNNFILQKNFKNVATSLYYQVNRITYNFDLRTLNLNKTPHSHFYKNPITYIQGFFMKGLFLHQNSVFFLYSSLFVIIPFGVFFLNPQKNPSKDVIN